MSKLLFEISHLWVRIAGTSLFLVLLVLFFNTLLLGIRNCGVYTGIVVSIMGIVYFSANPWVAKLLTAVWNNRVGHVVLCFLIGLTAFACLCAVVFSICMGAAIADKPKEEQTVVILGCKVRGDQPSLMLKKRLDAALEYLNAHPDVPVIVCGGQGVDESMTEAACMSAYLQKHGVSSDRITEDPASTSTYENLYNAREILEEQEWEHKIILVTDGYHQFRASLIAKSLHLETDKISAKTSWYLVPAYWVREWLGIIHLFIFG